MKISDIMIVYVGNHLFYFDEALKQGVICGGAFWTLFSSATFPRDAKGVVSIPPPCSLLRQTSYLNRVCGLRVRVSQCPRWRIVLIHHPL